jgi:protein SCO1/2
MSIVPSHWFRRSLWIALALFVTVTMAGCGRSHEFHGTPYDPVIAAADFKGINSDGTPFMLSDLRGKAVLLFFGYTSCPDICPTTLAKMKSVYDELGNQADGVEVLFVSLDPERDSPEQIRAYMKVFNPDFRGVHVAAEDLAQVKTDYGVYAEKQLIDPDVSAIGYTIDHTGWVYVIDQQGDLREVFALDAAPSDIADDLAWLVR